MRLLLCAFSTLLLCSCASVDRYTDAIAVNVDCEDYEAGVYKIRVRVTGPVRERDRFELECAD